MAEVKDSAVVTIDGKEFSLGDLSEAAKSQISNVQFVDGQILQLQNELAISSTARSGYLAALKVELSKNEVSIG